MKPKPAIGRKGHTRRVRLPADTIGAAVGDEQGAVIRAVMQMTGSDGKRMDPAHNSCSAKAPLPQGAEE
jgi:hypothetical protein